MNLPESILAFFDQPLPAAAPGDDQNHKAADAPYSPTDRQVSPGGVGQPASPTSETICVSRPAQTAPRAYRIADLYHEEDDYSDIPAWALEATAQARERALARTEDGFKGQPLICGATPPPTGEGTESARTAVPCFNCGFPSDPETSHPEMALCRSCGGPAAMRLLDAMIAAGRAAVRQLHDDPGVFHKTYDALPDSARYNMDAVLANALGMPTGEVVEFIGESRERAAEIGLL